MANGFGSFNLDQYNRMMNIPTPSPNVPRNLDVGFSGVPGTQTAPQVGGNTIAGMSPEMFSFAMDAFAGIVNPSQRRFTPGSDLAKSSIANKAFQQRQGGLTPADQAGDTSTQDVAVPGGIKRTITSFIPSADQQPSDLLNPQ